jgi:hypothetical protein
VRRGEGGKASDELCGKEKPCQAATKANVWLYRRTSGRVGGRGMDKRPLLLLTVPGRRSGALRRPKIRSVSAGSAGAADFMIICAPFSPRQRPLTETRGTGSASGSEQAVDERVPEDYRP